MSKIPDEWVDAFGEGWASVPEGAPGDRRRAGLAAVLERMRQMSYAEWRALDLREASETALDVEDVAHVMSVHAKLIGMEHTVDEVRVRRPDDGEEMAVIWYHPEREVWAVTFLRSSGL